MRSSKQKRKKTSKNYYCENFLCNWTHFTYHRGVILYAMVCGRLPFGDDTQVKKLQSTQLSFSRQVSYGKYITLSMFK